MIPKRNGKFLPVGSMRKALTIFCIGLPTFVLLNLVLSKGGIGRRLEEGGAECDNYNNMGDLYRGDGYMQISRSFGIAYVHTPKTGGSTIEYSKIFEEKRKCGTSPRSHHSVRKMKARQNDVSIMDIADANNSLTLATHIRDPCERFLSAFHYIMFDKRSKGIQRDMARLAIKKHDDVESFVDWLDDDHQMWRLIKRRLLHFRPMVTWLIHDDDTFGIDVVMCQEQWNEGIDRLFGTINRTAPDDVYLRKLHNADHRTCADLDRAYRDKIYSEYALDSCLFGFGDYRRGKFTIDDDGGNGNGGLTSSISCIGQQKNRSWFTDRWRFCKNALDKYSEELLLAG